MFTELHWIDGPWPGRLAISARPRGGDWLVDELKGWRAAGVTKVVSLLTPDEEDALGLEYEKQASLDAGLAFLSFPIVDRSVPSSDDEATGLIEELDNALTHGQQVVVHCRQGIGRAGLIASAILIAREVPSDDATLQVSRAPAGSQSRKPCGRSSGSAASSRTGGR